MTDIRERRYCGPCGYISRTHRQHRLDRERLARALGHLGGAPADGHGYGYIGQAGRNLAEAIAAAYEAER